MPFYFFVLFLLKGNGKRVAAVATCRNRIRMCANDGIPRNNLELSEKGRRTEKENNAVGRKGLKRKTSLLT